MYLSVLLSSEPTLDAGLCAEIDVDDPYLQDWLGHALPAFVDQVWSFAPGTVHVRITDGPLAGRQTTAIVYDRSFGPVLIGEAAFT